MTVTDSKSDSDAADAALRTSSLSAGSACLYVFPCVWEDLLKLGFSRDPLARMQSLHPRYYEFFDLERAFAVRLHSVREARSLETLQARRLRLHNAPAPLSINAAAGGAREWYRGAYAQLSELAHQLSAQGFEVLRPLRHWIAERLLASGPLLYALARTLSEEELEQRGSASRQTIRQRQLGDLLDAYPALGIGLDRWLEPEVLAWQRSKAG